MQGSISLLPVVAGILEKSKIKKGAFMAWMWVVLEIDPDPWFFCQYSLHWRTSAFPAHWLSAQFQIIKLRVRWGNYSGWIGTCFLLHVWYQLLSSAVLSVSFPEKETLFSSLFGMHSPNLYFQYGLLDI